SIGLAVILVALATASNAVAATTIRPPARHTTPAVTAAGRTSVDGSDVTLRDVEASNKKVSMAYGALVTMWTARFKALGARFVVPGIARYRGNALTECGVMHANNAQYCPEQNTIYFDDVFVARQVKAAADELGTDGDMVAVGIIAHEMGHAVQLQLGEGAGYPYERESAADCLAGAFTQQSQKDGSLEKGDLEEVFFGLAAAGDPTPEYTGDQRVNSQIALRAHYLGHGTREERQANFNAGLKRGPGACVAAFR
ncbi:MAG: neutral zinc metallopeptidase, partial [Gemmatimonadota bacterium]|nr:neutral zinc metallopeptidase [Gemmatimonadota bacterium]